MSTPWAGYASIVDDHRRDLTAAPFHRRDAVKRRHFGLRSRRQRLATYPVSC
jgi:hypothetical protein